MGGIIRQLQKQEEEEDACFFQVSSSFKVVEVGHGAPLVIPTSSIREEQHPVLPQTVVVLLPQITLNQKDT